METTPEKYCLRDEYLPKLTPESAATVYVSMVLYRDRLLDLTTMGATAPQTIIVQDKNVMVKK